MLRESVRGYLATHWPAARAVARYVMAARWRRSGRGWPVRGLPLSGLTPSWAAWSKPAS